MEYPKIHSLWKREGWYFDQNKKRSPDYQLGRQSFIIGDYAEPEFAAIREWEVDEKIDGTNIRIFYRDGKVSFGGRTGNAQLPCHLLDYLTASFGHWNLSKVFPIEEDKPHPNVILFGEGCGPKIQKNGEKYAKEPSFILFDVMANGWWLKREDVHKIAEELLIPSTPYLGVFKTDEIVELVKSKPNSWLSPDYGMMEGVICRSSPLMLYRKGTPIMWKLKCKEFP